MGILDGLQTYSIDCSMLGNVDPTVVPNPVLPSNLFHLIDPSQNYALYRREFDKQPGLPFLDAHIQEARRHGPVVLYELFQKVTNINTHSQGACTQINLS